MERIPVNTFNGLFDRGTDDVVPLDHFIDTLNTIYPFGGVQTRKGFDVSITLANILRYVVYKRINEATRLIILTTGGNLYDSTNLVTPIITIPGMTDFSMVPFYNRAYISPHDGKKGLPNEVVRVYDGTTIKNAGSPQPTGVLTAANSASSGKLDIGTHLFAVVFETSTGHNSKPGPTLFAVLNATGDKKADLTGIPTGPLGTTKRKIIATRAIQNYDGNQFSGEFYFVPSGVINDNATTTLTVDFYDSELQDSADYLFDILTTIPAGVLLSSYKGRLVVGGFDGDQSLVRFSKTNEPETFDTADSIVKVGITEAGGVYNGIENRQLFFMMKGTRTFSVNDVNDEPATWDVLDVDSGIGTYAHGISKILDVNGASTDRYFVADQSGIVVYDGIYRTPEFSFKIKDIWERINKSYFHTVEIANNPITKELVAAVPLDNATSPNYLLYADYQDGLDFNVIKWSVWQFQFNPTTVLFDMVNDKPQLKIGSNNGNVYIRSDSLNDNSQAIQSYVKFALMPQANGSMNTFTGFKSKVIGSGNMLVSTSIEDNKFTRNYPSIVLSADGPEVDRLLNSTGERVSLKLRVNSINEWFRISNLILFYYPSWAGRPK